MASSYPKVLKIGTQAAYNAIATKDDTVLYFTNDTLKIFKGGVDYTKYAKVVATLPSSTAELATGTIYLAQDTGKVSFYDGTNWHVISYPVAAMVDSEGAVIAANINDNKIATTKGIADYVAAIIGGSTDVVKSIAAGDSDAEFTYTTADGTEHDVVVPGVITEIADKEVSGAAQAAQFTLTDSSNVAHDYTVKGVVTGLAAGAQAAQITDTKSSGTADTVTVPGVVTGLAAGSADGSFSVTTSTGTHADVTVPGVFNAVEWNSSTRTLTFTDTSGVSTGADHVVDLGKDIFIDQQAPNRYENGNIYLYLNDGATTSQDTEIVIPVTGLITDYIGDDTDSIRVDINNTTHKVTASLITKPDVTTAGSEWENALKVDSTGAYVDLTDVEESIDALVEAITWGTF